jgi:hypothetical protein
MKFAAIEAGCRRNLLTIARAYQAAVPQKNGKPNKFSTISKYCRGDPRFFDTLEAQEAEYQRTGQRADKKGSFTLRIYDDVVLWFSKNWPPDVDYPTLEPINLTEGKQDGPKAKEAPEAPGKKGQGTQAGSTGDLLAKLRRIAG